MIKKKSPISEGHFFRHYEITRPFSRSLIGFKVSVIILINIPSEDLSIQIFVISL